MQSIGEVDMRRFKVTGWLVAVLFAGLVGWGAGLTFADTTAEPGTAGDPLVTKSYVDQLVADLTGKDGAGDSFRLVVVELQPGQQLIGEGGTEITVRSGYARVVGGEHGLNDATAGVRLKHNEQVPVEHMLVVPRSDGRGIVAENSTGNMVIAMVRGNYQIR